MEQLTNYSTLAVKQNKEWLEIATDFETKNKYSISTPEGSQAYFAYEHSGSLLARWFLKALRPFTVTVINAKQQEVVTVKRPFRFFFHHAKIHDVNGQVLGSIDKHFSLLRRTYTISDASGSPIADIRGPILKPWTFFIEANGQEIGKISKKWSGLLKESFSDADNFAVEFPDSWHAQQRAVLLGSVFLIDFVHFENKGNN